jgi:hypothetical protein
LNGPEKDKTALIDKINRFFKGAETVGWKGVEGLLTVSIKLGGGKKRHSTILNFYWDVTIVFSYSKKKEMRRAFLPSAQFP